MPSASIFVVGCLTGSLVGGYRCEHLGRRKSMMLDSVLMLAGFVCVAIAPNVEVFLLGELRVLLTATSALLFMFAGRLLTGHSAGSNLVSSPIFVSEISHPDMRGTTSVMTMVCYTSGFFLSMLAGASLPWRTAAWVFVTTPLLSFSLLLFCRVSWDEIGDVST